MNLSTFFNYPTVALDVPSEAPPFLAHWSQRSWSKLLALTQTYRFSTGDWVLRRAESTRALYLVTFGQFELLTQAAEMPPGARVQPLEAGAIIGAETFFDAEPYGFDVCAVSEGEMVRLSFESFEVFAAREPELAREVLLDLGRILSSQVRRLHRT